ncbi:MAG: CoA pyrophosphatase [Acidobacteriota bacterium]
MAASDDSSKPADVSWLSQLGRALGQPPPRRLPPRDARPAAVLVPLYVDAGALWMVLTKRTETLPTHKGQIAFPGGGVEASETPWDAALRETHEEIGIAPSTVMRIGQLDETVTPSGFSIVPCVGAVPFPLQTRANEDEIDEIFTVPLQALASPQLVEDRTVVIDGQPRALRVYHVGSRRIWGVTARIAQNLLHRLGLDDGSGLTPPDDEDAPADA